MSPPNASAVPPVIDISPFLKTPIPTSPAAASAAAGMLDSSRRFGYAHVCGHGIPEAATARLLHASRRFFHARARAEACGRPRDAGGPAPEEAPPPRLALSPTTYRGYQRVGENVTQGRRDAHRALDYIRQLARDAPCLAEQRVVAGGEPLLQLACGENVYPDPSIERGVADFVAAAVVAGRAVMACLCVALNLPEDAFGNAFRDPFYLLRLIHYPGLQSPGGFSGTHSDLGCGGHRDYGWLTFIASSEEPGSMSALQVSKSGSEDGFVPAVVPPKEALLLNFGDCLECLTNGLLPATLHRVVIPQMDRTSIAAFIEPQFSWPIQPLQVGTSEALDSPSPFSSPASAGDHQGRLAGLRKFSCYGEYLLSKVSSNFSLYNNNARR